MEVELRLKVKGVTIELTPKEARELVRELVTLTGQHVDPAPVVVPTVWPSGPYPPYRPWITWNEPCQWIRDNTTVSTENTSWQTFSEGGGWAMEARAIS